MGGGDFFVFLFYLILLRGEPGAMIIQEENMGGWGGLFCVFVLSYFA